MNIYLIGYRCTGKTSVGRELSQLLGWSFIDADVYLTEAYGTTIADMVAKDGWPTFRKNEKAILEKLSAFDQHVIATGGGVILDPANVDRMRTTGMTIWLTASAETIVKRMNRDALTKDQRPSLTDSASMDQEILETLSQRIPLYQAAQDIIVQTDDATVAQITEGICEMLKKMPNMR